MVVDSRLVIAEKTRLPEVNARARELGRFLMDSFGPSQVKEGVGEVVAIECVVLV